MSWQLHGFDAVEFIQDYWQKKPCLIRQVIPDYKSPISPEELAGLACESEVHSRLVVEKDADTRWSVSYGPFQEKDFTTLPETHYSLLVSECEKWIPDLAELLDLFRFIPDWRIDDLMVSYASPGGSVGPHNDEYDVFLLQARGSRKWLYTDTRLQQPDLIPGLELAILENFSADQEVVLIPGDMLYLPPGIAHHGIALDDCMTISIGFRAPTAIEVFESIALEVGLQKSALKRYSDADLETGRHFAEITKTEIERFKAMALSLIEQPQNIWVDCVGKLLSDSVETENRENHSPASPDNLFSNDWIVNSESRMLYYRCDSDVRFFCNAQSFELPNSSSVIEIIQDLCKSRFISGDKLKAFRSQKSLIEMFLVFEKTGTLIPAEDKCTV